MYTQTELMQPPELSQLSAVGKIAEQLALRSEIAEQIEDWLSVAKNRITVVKSVHRWATVEELKESGWEMEGPRNLFRERQSNAV